MEKSRTLPFCMKKKEKIENFDWDPFFNTFKAANLVGLHLGSFQPLSKKD